MAATVLGGLFGGETFATIHTTSSLRKRASLALGRKSQLALRQVMRALDGVAAGANATKNYTRVDANQEMGGKRTIETQVLINRATTAADVTDINADILSLASKTYNNSPPANLDGNPLGTR